MFNKGQKEKNNIVKEITRSVATAFVCAVKESTLNVNSGFKWCCKTETLVNEPI